MSQRRALAPPRDLTIPDDRSTTAYDVLSRAIGRVLGEATTIVQARSRGAIGGDAGALASAVRRPEIGVLVRALRGKKGSAAQAIAAELVVAVCFEHARAHALPRPIRLARLPKRILSSAARVAIDVPDDVRALTFSSGRLVVERASGATAIDLDSVATSPPSGASLRTSPARCSNVGTASHTFTSRSGPFGACQSGASVSWNSCAAPVSFGCPPPL